MRALLLGAALAALAGGPDLLGAQQRVAGPDPGASWSRLAGPREVQELRKMARAPRASTGRLVIGGMAGALAGLLACYAISEAIAEAENASHCTAKGNIVMGLGGAALGVLVAWVTAPHPEQSDAH